MYTLQSVMLRYLRHPAHRFMCIYLWDWSPMCICTYVIEPWCCIYTSVIYPLSCVWYLIFVSNRTGLSMLPRQTGLPESCFIAEEAVDWCIQNIQEVKDVTSGIGLMQVRVNFYYIYKDLQKNSQTFNRPCTCI